MNAKPPQQNRLISDDDDAPPAPEIRSEPVASNTTQTVSATRAPRKRRMPEGKGAYPDKRQVTAYIDRQLFMWLKSISVQTDKPMIQLMEEALGQYVNTYAAQQKFKG